MTRSKTLRDMEHMAKRKKPMPRHLFWCDLKSLATAEYGCNCRAWARYLAAKKRKAKG